MIEAFGRSYELVRGHGWTVFGAIVVAFLILIGGRHRRPPIIGAAIGDLAGRIIFAIIANILTAPFAALVASVLFFGLGGASTAVGRGRGGRPGRARRLSESPAHGARVERRNAIGARVSINGTWIRRAQTRPAPPSASPPGWTEISPGAGAPVPAPRPVPTPEQPPQAAGAGDPGFARAGRMRAADRRRGVAPVRHPGRVGPRRAAVADRRGGRAHGERAGSALPRDR